MNSRRSAGSKVGEGPVKIDDSDPIEDILNQRNGGGNRFVSNFRVSSAQSNLRQSKELDFSGGEDEIGIVNKAKAKPSKSVRF